MDSPTRLECVAAYRSALAALADERRGEDDAETLCIPDCDGVRSDCRCKGNVAEPGCERLAPSLRGFDALIEEMENLPDA